jgi:hypothetical protein
MSRNARAVIGFLGSGVGGVIIAFLTWSMFASPTEIGSTGLYIDRIGGTFAMGEWAGACGPMAAVLGGLVGLLFPEDGS